jgi:hypothetical protein
MRDQIVSEIRRLAAMNGGHPPGRMKFERESGIKMTAWYGVFWSKWGDALAEAGFTSNKLAEKTQVGVLFENLTRACRHYGRIPTSGELRMYGRQQVGFPSHSTFTNAFPSRTDMIVQFGAWVKENGAVSDVLPMLPTIEPVKRMFDTVKLSEGYVYLIQSGSFYKIGRSNELERRVKQIRVALPDASNLVHTIRTDDPPGIEAYWHRRFQDRRANGEWFRLTATDVAAFRRRRYQ